MKGRKEAELRRTRSLIAHAISTPYSQKSHLWNLELWRGSFLETACPQAF